MTLEKLTKTYLPAIEASLRAEVERANGQSLNGLQAMMAYHMGWEGEGAGPEASGKRIRPLLVLLVTAACGAGWQRALPAAAAVELLHNFSLIHDDIEDNSPLRRGRPTVWARWGIPQAVNTGDAMFVLSQQALLGLGNSLSPAATIQAMDIFQEACLNLTRGQYLDLSYENRQDLSPEDYWPMVSGKTAALLTACTELGALAAEVPAERRSFYRQFGRLLGLAFQAYDDFLGIWGDSALTGKSAESDLASGKKSLPVLFGISRGGEFAKRWYQGPLSVEEVPVMAKVLEQEGGLNFTQEQANRLTEEALHFLEQASPQGEAGAALRQLANKLLHRQS